MCFSFSLNILSFLSSLHTHTHAGLRLTSSAVETWKQTQSREGTVDRFRFFLAQHRQQSGWHAVICVVLHTWNKEKQSVMWCYCIWLINVWRSQRCRRDKRPDPLFGLFALLRLNTMTFKYDISVTSRHGRLRRYLNPSNASFHALKVLRVIFCWQKCNT